MRDKIKDLLRLHPTGIEYARGDDGKPETGDTDYCPEHYAMYKAQMLEIKKDSPLEP